MKNVVGRILLTVFLFSIIIACEKEEVSDIIIQNVDSSNYEPIEIELMSLVNSYRNQLGLSSLSSLKLISKEAENHTIYMIGQGRASHDNFSLRLTNLMESVEALNVGENISYGKQTANEVLQSWLLSSSHRAKIEGKSFTNFGISAKKNNTGNYFITQIYISK